MTEAPGCYYCAYTGKNLNAKANKLIRKQKRLILHALLLYLSQTNQLLSALAISARCIHHVKLILEMAGIVKFWQYLKI